MKKLFKRFAPLFLALVMVLGSCLTVSAAENTVRENAKKVYDLGVSKISDASWEDYHFNYFLITYSSGFDYYKMIVSDVPIYFSSGKVMTSGSGGSFNYFTVDYDFSKNKVSYGGISGGSNSTPGKSIIVFADSFGALYSNYDVYMSDGVINIKADTTDFFPRTPLLVPAVEGAAPEEALKEVILLIPLSILFLAGCLGLRKALRLLLTLLRRA